MEGWDKKCFERLQSLLTLETLKGRDRQIVEDLHDRYERRDPHFYTGKQRKLIDSIYNKYFDRNGQPITDRWPAKDKRLRADLFLALENDEVPKCKLTLAEDLARWCRESVLEDGITQGRRTLISEIVDLSKNSGVQKQMYQDLYEKFENNGITSGSPAFAESVLRFFEDKGMWTDVQQEHIEKMLADNEDPDD